MKCPQLRKPKVTTARNQNSIGDRTEKKPWEKPGSVGGPFPLWPDKPVVCSTTRYHAKACNRHAGPLDDACEDHALPPLGVKMSRMYEVGVTNGEPAGAIISPMTTAHGPKTSDIVP